MAALLSASTLLAAAHPAQALGVSPLSVDLFFPDVEVGASAMLGWGFTVTPEPLDTYIGTFGAGPDSADFSTVQVSNGCNGVAGGTCTFQTTFAPGSVGLKLADELYFIDYEVEVTLFDDNGDPFQSLQSRTVEFPIHVEGTGIPASLPQSAVPLPAALPLYGTGLAVIGFFGWRRRRKAAA